MIDYKVEHTFRPNITLKDDEFHIMETILKDNKNLTILTITTTTDTKNGIDKNNKRFYPDKYISHEFACLEVSLELNNKYVKKNKLLFKKANYKDGFKEERIQIPLGPKNIIKIFKEIIKEWYKYDSRPIKYIEYERVTGTTIDRGFRRIKLQKKYTSV